MSSPTRTAQEWFAEAARDYVDGHQACAWCGGRHRVFKTRHGTRLEYHCTDCDFYVCHDEQTNAYAVEPGCADAAGSGCADDVSPSHLAPFTGLSHRPAGC
jgi:hypothetical protein